MSTYSLGLFIIYTECIIYNMKYEIEESKDGGCDGKVDQVAGEKNNSSTNIDLE